MRIIYEDDTELANFEAENKGYRNDVVVEIGNKKYRLYVIAMKRLQQDFETEYHDSKYSLQEPNMIIVNSVTKEKIENFIGEIVKEDFFERLDRNGF